MLWGCIRNVPGAKWKSSRKQYTFKFLYKGSVSEPQGIIIYQSGVCRNGDVTTPWPEGRKWLLEPQRRDFCWAATLDGGAQPAWGHPTKRYLTSPFSLWSPRKAPHWPNPTGNDWARKSVFPDSEISLPGREAGWKRMENYGEEWMKGIQQIYIKLVITRESCCGSRDLPRNKFWSPTGSCKLSVQTARFLNTYHPVWFYHLLSTKHRFCK